MYLDELVLNCVHDESLDAAERQERDQRLQLADLQGRVNLTQLLEQAQHSHLTTYFIVNIQV